MSKTAFKWLLLPLCTVVMSAAGLVPGTAVARGNDADCTMVGDPIHLELNSKGSPYDIFSQGHDVEITATVSNCSDSDWSGSVALNMTGDHPGCATYFTGADQQITVRRGLMQSVRFRGHAPTCPGSYAIDGTAYDSAVQAVDRIWVSAVYPPNGRY